MEDAALVGGRRGASVVDEEATILGAGQLLEVVQSVGGDTAVGKAVGNPEIDVPVIGV